MPAGSGINRAVFALRRTAGAGDLGLDFLSGAEAGVEQPLRIEPRQGCLVVGEMLGLPPHVAIPIETEPGEVFADRRVEPGTAAAAVDVLDTQEKPPAGLARRMPAFPGRTNVAQVQISGRARRETRDDFRLHRLLASFEM